MLVLTRKIGERIFVGDEVIITVLRLGTEEVKLGIDAPRNCPILREELASLRPIQAGLNQVADLGRR